MGLDRTVRTATWSWGLLLASVAVSVSAGATITAQRKPFKPVTDVMLQHPDPGDWINWRRTMDGWGYSPLNQITAKNAHQLQLVWSWALGPGISEATPLVYDGVMYVPSPNGRVQALNAVTGDLLWDFNHESPPLGYGIMRSLAIYDDKIYVPTRDAHVLALDARTGKVAWDRIVADSKIGYHYGSGPLVVRGKVVVGIQGCQKYKDDVCFISAYDAKTGAEVWRRSTIARPGEPGGDTWGDLPLMFRAGGDAWITGSYDPALNLIYWSTAQAKPWAQFQRKDGGGSNLYTSSTLALEPDTGKIVWYHQFIPGESHDMDEVFENVLIDHDGRRSLFKMGKLGILWEIDRTTGRFVAAHDLGYQTLYELNRQTGALTLRPDAIPRPGVELSFCPSLLGLKGWQAMAYSPQMQALFVPLNLACVKVTFTNVEQKEGANTTGIRGMSHQPHSASPVNNGELVAMDIRSGRILWRHATPTRMQSAVLTTAGGLVVAGDWDRYLYVHEATTGNVVFQTRMPGSVQGFPITYAVNGKQYLAVPVGSGSALYNQPVQLDSSRSIPPAVNGIFVFALSDRAGTD